MSTKTETTIDQTNEPKLDLETLKTAKEEIEAVCKKHNIVLVPVVVHQGDRTFSSIEISPVLSKEQVEKLQNAQPVEAPDQA